MKKTTFLKTALTAAVIAGAALSTPALAADHGHGQGHGHKMGMGTVVVDGAWARASAKMAKNGAAYFMMKNTGDNADKLLSASSDVASKTELHTHLNENGVMKMRKLKDPVVVEAGNMAAFKPGGHHVMLMGLKAPLVNGQSFPLTLHFEKAGAITVDVMIKKGDMQMDHKMDQGMGHKH